MSNPPTSVIIAIAAAIIIVTGIISLVIVDTAFPDDGLKYGTTAPSLPLDEIGLVKVLLKSGVIVCTGTLIVQMFMVVRNHDQRSLRA